MKDGSVTINQAKYIGELIKKHGLWDANSAATPVSPSCELKPYDLMPKTEKGIGDFDYRSVIGGLLYAVKTRPDIYYAVNVLSRYCNKPHPEHVTQVKRILRYLRGTLHLGLGWKRTGEYKPRMFVDANFAGYEAGDSKSRTSYIFMVNDGPIAALSKRQSVVALSTTEAEYIALSESIKETLFCRQILAQMGEYVPGITQHEPTITYEDNEGAKLIANADFYEKRSKHYRVRFDFVRDERRQGTITVQSIDTKDQIADINTKALCEALFVQCRNSIMKDCKPSMDWDKK